MKLLIIGSGPAGYTAAIYAARANLKPVLYQGLEPGGQLMITTDVENYPGYSDGILGPQMMDDFRKQAERMGADIRFGIATKVDFSNSLHKIIIDEKKEIHADTVIISTGAAAKWLGIESEKLVCVLPLYMQLFKDGKINPVIDLTKFLYRVPLKRLLPAKVV